jgi:hypothetical protein
MASSSKLAAVLSLLLDRSRANAPSSYSGVKKFCGGSLFDDASKVIGTHEHKGDFKEW